jgi:GNAT superfamily N-acetyltransferase
MLALAKSDIRIEVIQVGDLIRFAEEFFRNPGEQVMAPISRQRARGMAHNPFADPRDPGLIVAYAREKVVAHWSIVPGLLKTREGSSKVLWGSALFIHPDYRARGVLLNLIRTALSFEEDIVSTGVPEAVYQIYKVLGFRELKPLEVCWLIVSRPDLFGTALSFARRRSKIPEAILKIADTLTPVTQLLAYRPRPTRLLYLRWLAHAAKKELAGIAFREVQRVQPAAATPPTSPHFVRDAEAVNWMLEHPWVLERKTAPGSASDPPFFFNDLRDSFRHYAIEFDDSLGRLAGYLAFSIQADRRIKRTLKLTDFNVRTEKDLAIVFWIAALYSARHRVDHFEASSAISPFMTQLPLARFMVRSSLRRYLCNAVKGGQLEKVFGELEPQYGDGDCPFT